MSASWRPSIRVWPFADAPEEYRRLCPEPDGTEELVIFVPKEFAPLFDSGDWATMPPALWFLDHPPKREGLLQTAGAGFGDYSLHVLPDGSRVAITEGSAPDLPS
jgi:hypothetical protein